MYCLKPFQKPISIKYIIFKTKTSRIKVRFNIQLTYNPNYECLPIPKDSNGQNPSCFNNEKDKDIYIFFKKNELVNGSKIYFINELIYDGNIFEISNQEIGILNDASSNLLDIEYELPCPIYKMKEIIHEYANLDNLDYVHVIIVSYPATYQDIENAYEYDLSKKETYVYLFNQLDLPVPDKLK